MKDENSDMTNNQQDNHKKNKRDVTLVNYNIRCANVRIVDSSDSPAVMKRDDAISLAQSKGLDLVQISFDTANHLAVCKIIDYGKFKYEQSKREKNAKKIARANAVDTKTIQFSVATDDNDKQRLISQAKDFLGKGDKVKLSIRFRNKRESCNLEYAKNVMKEILSSFDGLAVLDTTPSLSGREMFCIIRPSR